MDFDQLLEKKYAPYAILIFIALLFYALIYTFSGDFSIGSHNWYNNYSRQAYSWIQGRLDLPYNRPYLEIAFFGDRMYISFPPFPSIFLLPFVIFYGYNTPDHAIALGLTLVTLIYAYKIAFKLLAEKKLAMFFSLFLILGTNYLHISLWGAVWWLAQNIGFTFLMISVYYAISDNKKHSAISLFALCASMGCRPFNMFYLPIILLLIYKREEGWFFTILGKIFAYAIPAIALGMVYMWLNYARFGSIFEFGHNYLPEHTIDPLGQFHSSRVVYNLSMMFFNFDITHGIRNGFPHYRSYGYTTFAFWIASPMFLCFAIYQFVYWNRKKEVPVYGELDAVHEVAADDVTDETDYANEYMSSPTDTEDIDEELAYTETDDINVKTVCAGADDEDDTTVYSNFDYPTEEFVSAYFDVTNELVADIDYENITGEMADTTLDVNMEDFADFDWNSLNEDTIDTSLDKADDIIIDKPKESTSYTSFQQFKKAAIENLLIKLIPILVFIHIFAFSFHRTLGGRQFGSRYIADALPIIFLGLLLMVAKLPKVKHMMYNFIPMLFGALINFHGTIMFLTFYFPFSY